MLELTLGSMGCGELRSYQAHLLEGQARGWKRWSERKEASLQQSGVTRLCRDSCQDACRSHRSGPPLQS
jgi:hypothetical protein